jgi:hypothetical protein
MTAKIEISITELRNIGGAAKSAVGDASGIGGLY